MPGTSIGYTSVIYRAYPIVLRHAQAAANTETMGSQEHPLAHMHAVNTHDKADEIPIFIAPHICACIWITESLLPVPGL